MRLRTCKVCVKEFEAKVSNQKFCGKPCFDLHRKEYSKQNSEKRKVDRTCRQCGKTYRRVLEKKGFCTISCGSKWNVENGNFETWKHSSTNRELTGKTVECSTCNRPLYVKKSSLKEQENHFCDRKCAGVFSSKRFSGSGNPMYGKKLSEESLLKQKETLLKNHGVTNAFYLSDRKTTSKPQLDIFDRLSLEFIDLKFECEKRIDVEGNRFFVDIACESLKIAIEFNGDYWHCNPATFAETFFHPKKKQYAKDVWEQDEKRKRLLEEAGYSVVVVWEKDYCLSKQSEIQRLVELIKKRQ